jgi:hypothetical protein
VYDGTLHFPLVSFSIELVENSSRTWADRLTGLTPDRAQMGDHCRQMEVPKLYDFIDA